MIFEDQISFFLIQSMWVLMLIFLFSDLRRRIRLYIVQEWDINYSIQTSFKRGIISTVVKLYTGFQDKKPKQLAETVAIEICKNAGLYYNTSIFAFLQLRQEPQELKKYFKNDELVSFLSRPDVWTNVYMLRKKTIFSRKHTTVTPDFLAELERMVDIFRFELASQI
ncbi:MAG: hypothetical protein INQ03_01245 [Candidatus Heimdallarchaeota archaeon]|nr:hypothetical protein [Candidatus Heimdallarchaeota archaeon]